MLAGILSVVPDSAIAGTEDLLVTLTLDGSVTPPLPPSSVTPSSVEIGTIQGTDLVRNDTVVTALFDIPADATAGLQDVVLNFPGPSYTLPGGFTIVASGLSVVTIAATDSSAAEEGLDTGTFTITRTGNTDGDLTVQWSVGGSATEGDDYLAIARTAVILDGQSSVALTITPVDDAVDESRETATLTISADAAYTIGTAGSATVNIVDNDGVVSGGTYTVVDTGQSLFYGNSGEIAAPSEGDVFYGQDASFTGNTSSYTLSTDGLTVNDNVTGLTWTQSPDWEGDGDIDANDKLTFSEAHAYVETLNATSYGGYSDWRMPSLKELYSLIDFSGEDPSGYSGTDTSGLVPFIDTDYFAFDYGDTDAGERIIDAQFWSSNEYVSTTMNGDPTVFGVNFADGRIKGYPKTKPVDGSENTAFFYFVRGNTDYGVNDLADNGDDTITDSATGLQWAQDDSGTGMDWEAALSWVEDLNDQNYLGYSDWRLPNIKELQSIVDYTRSPDTTNSAAIDPLFNVTSITDEGGSTDYPYYWSSTTHVNYVGVGRSAAYIAFGEAEGYMNGSWMDVHGAGCQRSDPKEGDASDYPTGHGPQGDAVRIDNFVRLVRAADVVTSEPFEGYNLFSSLNSTTAYLMDNDGNFVHSWDTDYRPGNAMYLLESGALLHTGNVNNTTFDAGGEGGIVQTIDWDGNVTWEYEYSSTQYLQHHDVEMLPNGNVLMVAWQMKTEAEALAAGRDSSLLTAGELWPDSIIEVEPTGSSGGNIVWEWHAWDHLVQDYDSGQANYGVVADHPELIDLNYTLNSNADWHHINSVDYNAELDQIVLSVHNFSEIWVIDHSTTTAEAASHSGGDSGIGGDLLYRWGNPQTYGGGTAADQQLFVQHDAEWIEAGLPGEGDILIFNNGGGRSDGDYSSIEEIVTPLNPDGSYALVAGSDYGPDDPTWNYTDATPTDFYSQNISGQQRLANGNTLICDGPNSYFFEVTAAGETVWEYDYTGSVFRVERYAPEYSGFDGTPLDDDPLTLSLSIAATSISESAGAAAATGTVTRGGDSTATLTVTLASSDTSEATVPTTVVIPANQASVTFDIAAVDDSVADGTQTVNISASAAGYTGDSDTLQVVDDDQNATPTADAGGPYSGTEGDTITLTGAGSTDSDGTLATYAWDLDNDGQYDDATGVTANFASAYAGTFTVGLRVTDDDGGSGTDAAIVSVSVAGDMNNDGYVNGLDVSLFVDVLLSGSFDAAADVNDDGEINGLDVAPFVAAVVGGGDATGVALLSPSTNDLAAKIERPGAPLDVASMSPTPEGSSTRLPRARHAHDGDDHSQLIRHRAVERVMGRRLRLELDGHRSPQKDVVHPVAGDWQATVDLVFGGGDWIRWTARQNTRAG